MLHSRKLLQTVGLRRLWVIESRRATATLSTRASCMPATRRDDNSKLNHGHLATASPATMEGTHVQLRRWVSLMLFAPRQPLCFEYLCGTWPHGLRGMRSYHVQSKQLCLDGAGHFRQQRNSANMTLRSGTLKARPFSTGLWLGE